MPALVVTLAILLLGVDAAGDKRAGKQGDACRRKDDCTAGLSCVRGKCEIRCSEQ